MKTNQTFAILFWIAKSKARNGKAPIYCRVSINSKRAEIASKRKIEIEKWNNVAGLVKGNSEEARTINTFLSNMRTEILNHYNILLANSERITSEKLKNLFLGIKENEKTLLEVFKYHNDRMEERIGIECVKATHTKFQTILKKVKLFIPYQYKTKDIDLLDLNNKFVVEFEHYLRTQHKIANNTAMNYIKSLKKIMNLCVANDWLVKNPFMNFRCSTKKVNRDVLSVEDLIKIEQHSFESTRLDEVRDVFIFCCYTGFAFIDVFQLTTNELTYGIDGNKWIYTSRQKTGNNSNVPLLPGALRIIEKYNDHPSRIITKKLLPVKTNQKMNEYLKEIAIICKVNKRLTMHLARHTFVTTITLSNGVPIETVSKMLGHSKLSTTQIYAKVLENKVSDDMKILMQKMTNKDEERANSSLKHTV